MRLPNPINIEKPLNKSVLIILIIIFSISGLYYFKLYSHKALPLIQNSIIPNNWKTYVNKDYKFKFDYPPTWEVNVWYDNIDSGSAFVVSPKLLPQYISAEGARIEDLYFVAGTIKIQIMRSTKSEFDLNNFIAEQACSLGTHCNSEDAIDIQFNGISAKRIDLSSKSLPEVEVDFVQNNPPIGSKVFPYGSYYRLRLDLSDSKNVFFVEHLGSEEKGGIFDRFISSFSFN